MSEGKLTVEVGRSLQLSECPLFVGQHQANLIAFHRLWGNPYEITVHHTFFLGRFSSLFYLRFCQNQTSNGSIFSRLFFFLPKKTVHCTYSKCIVFSVVVKCHRDVIVICELFWKFSFPLSSRTKL